MAHWSRPYADTVRAFAAFLRADACSGVPDLWFKACCNRHDLAYRRGIDPLGRPVTRRRADAQLWWCMAKESPLGRASPVAWLYWMGVRLLGWWAWRPAAPLSIEEIAILKRLKERARRRED